MKGVILAGGKGTRLRHGSEDVNKDMVPIAGQPMVFYPVQTLKHLGISEVMVISSPEHIDEIATFLGNGSQHGIRIVYGVQDQPRGVAHAISLAKDYAAGGPIVVLLGDNIFENSDLPRPPEPAGIADAFFYFVKARNLSRFGVPVFENKRLVKIEEKPQNPQSAFAVTGLYIYPPDVFDIISTLKPSQRGELEITDVNNLYIKQERCGYVLFHGFWVDAGTPESLKEATHWALKIR